MSYTPKISVIISTYNSVKWLENTLLSYEYQIFRPFEIIIADDGSTQETTDFIEKYKKTSAKFIKHIWHEDKGFRKCEILNKAIVATSTDYIIMTDGDCIAKDDFVQNHYERRERNYFLSGGYFKLPLELSHSISKDDIATQRCFDIDWLRDNGLPSSYKNQKLSSGFVTSKLMESLTPTNASWNGHNASGWKADILAVNGFDERMQYGGEDRELGERMMNNGIKPKQIRYSAICLHLEHERGYVKPDMILNNKKIRAHTKEFNTIVTPYGIEKTTV